MKKVLVSFSASSVASREFLTGVFDYVNEGHTWNIELGPEPYSLTPRYIASAVRNGIDGIITGINRTTPGYKALIKLDLPEFATLIWRKGVFSQWRRGFGACRPHNNLVTTF